MKKLLGAVIFVHFLLSGCGGGGGGGTATQSTLSLSGAVLAPSGQIAFERDPHPLTLLAEALLPSASAALTGLAAVADGTIVELVRIDASGSVVSTLGQTTTSGGRYSFDLQALGASYAADLVVRVHSAASAAQMRAFATGPGADITPASEAAVQMLLAHVAGGSLQQLTLEEVESAVAAIDQLTGVEQVASGGDVATSVNIVKSAVDANNALATFLRSVAVAGQSRESPGDVAEYFALKAGGTYTFRYSVAGSQQGTIVHRIEEATLANNDRVLSYIDLDGERIHVRSESAGFFEYDPLAQQPPLQWFTYPLRTGAERVVLSAQRVALGIDVDGDGRLDSADLAYTSQVLGFEPLSIGIGTFSNAAKVRLTRKATLFASGGRSAEVTQIDTQWHVPGLGMAKRERLLAGPNRNIRETIELSGDVVVQVLAAANDVVYDAMRKRVYVTQPLNGTLAALDERSGLSLPSLALGLSPSALAISDDNSYLYVGFAGKSSVQRIALESFSPDLEIALVSSGASAETALDLQVLPGLSRSVMVAQGPAFQSGFPALVSIFDDSTPRPKKAGTGGALALTSLPGIAVAVDTNFSELHRLAYDAQGVVLQHKESVFALRAELAPDANGNVYASNGVRVRVGDFVTGNLFSGSSNISTVASDRSGHRLLFVESDFASRKIFVRMFDAATSALIEEFSFEIDPFALQAGSIGNVRGLVPVGRQSLAFVADGRLVMITSPRLAKVLAQAPPPPPTSNSPVRSLDLVTADLVSDPFSRRLYASVPASVLGGNSIAVIEPQRGEVTEYVAVGQQPNKLALSDDGRFLYVGLDGEGAIQQLRLPGFTPERKISLGVDFFSEKFVAKDLAVMPGAPNTIAVGKGLAQGFGSQSIVLFDSGVARAAEVAGGEAIDFAPNADRLFVCWGGRPYAHDIAATGIFFGRDLSSLQEPSCGDIKVAAGQVYTSGGAVFDAASEQRVPAFAALTTAFPSPAAVLPDVRVGRTYFLSADFGAPPRIRIFGTDSRLELGAISLGLSPSPGPGYVLNAFVLWGTDEIAFRSSTKQVFLVRPSSAVP